MTDKTFEDVLYNVAEGVATITLNRPDRLNAWTGAMEASVKAAMHEATDDDAVKVIVVTGAGRGFCAGADMGNLDAISSSDGAALRAERKGPVPFDADAPDHFKKSYTYFPSVPKPIIGAINGPCAGMGLAIACFFDIRIASSDAVFSTAFARRGLIAEHGLSWILPRLMGMGKAADLLFSARRVEAEEAERIGLVDRMVSANEFPGEVAAYAKMLATEVSPRSLKNMKREIWRDQFLELGPAIDEANKDMMESLSSEDFKEGVAHFIEKRTPNFTGK
jgi:enoyl-CoA hydratase/carnithine racemase